MVETAPQVPINPENNKNLQSVVNLLGKAGYYYEMQATHEDDRGFLHFNKPLTDRFYPHFHLMYKPDDGKISIHMDIRRHKSRHIKPELTDEVIRLYGIFTIISQSQDSKTAEIANNFSKQLREASLFNTSETLNRPGAREQRFKSRTVERKRMKLKKEDRQSHLQKKYKDEDVETWQISDWEPIDPELHEEVNRQLHLDTDKIN